MPKTDPDGKPLLDDPDMGAGQDVGEDAEAETSPDTEGKAEGDEQTEFSAFMQKKGFKSARDLMASFEEKERKVTDLSNQVLLGQQQPVFVPQPAVQAEPEERMPLRVEDPYELITNKEKFDDFLEQMDSHFDKKIQKRMEQEKVKQMTSEAMRLRNRNPQEFAQLRPTMVELAKLPQYADYSISELYEAAKTAGTQIEQAITERLKRNLGLEGVDLKALSSRINPAISSSSGGGASRPDNLTDIQKREQEIKTNILKAKRIEE